MSGILHKIRRCRFVVFFLRVIITCHYFYHTFFVTILGSGLGNIMGITPPAVSGASGITQSSPSVHEIMDQQQGLREKSANEGPSKAPVGCERLLHEMSTTNTGTPGNSSPQFNPAPVGTSGPSETSVHHAARPRHLLSLKKLRELKENATKILKSYDGQFLELQQFKKVYKDTFGKRLKPKRIEEAMPLLDDVFVLEQSGKEVTIKLKDQAEKRSDSPQSVSGNLLGES